MKIKELFKQKQPTISFEVFPPNKIYTLEKVYEVIDELSLFKTRLYECYLWSWWKY